MDDTQALQQWKSSKAQLIASVEAHAKKFAGLDIDIDEMLAELSKSRWLYRDPSEG
jgi:hypothetical protein